MIELNQVEGLSAKIIQTLKRHDIHTVEDMLLYYPSRFEDYTILPIEECPLDTNVTVAGLALGRASVTTAKSNLSIMSFYVNVDETKVRVTIFNRHFLRNQIHDGKFVRLTGKFDGGYKKFVASDIALDDVGSAINPVFNIKGLTDKKVLEIKEKLYYDYADTIQETLPEEVRARHQLINRQDAIRFINIPETMEETEQAIRRIKFEELFFYQLNVKYMMHCRKHYPEGVPISFDKEKVKSFIGTLPFTLTQDQQTAVDAVLEDLSSPYKMNRLLQGEVGSGKTVVAAVALYAVVTAGYQGAIMVPTEVLALQHHQTFQDLFQSSSLNIRVITSSISSKERKEILSGLEDGLIDIVIGTHSLFQKDVLFSKLGLVITDEEHRFGVRQRVSLVGKGYRIDHLKMSATPIPRTLAISVLGDSDISVIKTMPGNKKEVITKHCDYNKRHEIFAHIEEEIKRGRQVYIITPMIEEAVMDLKNATDVYENTKKYYKGFCEVGLIHGRLSPMEKEEVMTSFSKNEIQILVATSVIEVGVNVVNATTIVILDADRFGIAQLHQMRGRVRRSDHQSYCFLLSKSTVDTAVKRLQLVAGTSDGFELAEEDLLIRGSGDIFSEKQTGNVAFKMADVVLDRELFDLANEEASYVLNSKKLLTDPYFQEVLGTVHQNYELKKKILE